LQALLDALLLVDVALDGGGGALGMRGAGNERLGAVLPPTRGPRRRMTPIV